MRDLTDRALDTASALGAGYADVRASSAGSTRAIADQDRAGSRASPPARARASASASSSTARGASPAAHILTAAEADRVAAEAVRIARASATALRDPAVLDDRPPAHGTYETPVEEDPFDDPARAQDRRPARRRPGRQPGSKGIAFTESMYAAQREWKTFAATDGSFTEQTITHVGDRGRGQRGRRRRAPAPELPGFRRRLEGGAATSTSARLDLADQRRAARRGGGRAAERAAVPVAAGSRSSSTRASSTSRSTRAAATRPSSTASSAPRRRYAGTSFLTTDKLDEGFRYGSDLIDIVADATAPGGMGTFGWDDEGVAAQAVPLVQGGIFVGYLSSRETAPRIGRTERRRDAGRRLEPHPAHPDDQHQPAAQARA